MKLSLNWIQDFVDLSGIDPEDIKTKLSLTTAEIEGIEIVGGELPGIVIGEVLTVGPHPGADRLRLTRVSTGDDEFPVVCGAPNVEQGQRIAFATIGAVLPDGLKIKRAKIRGEESCGMICSEVELGIGEDGDGILVLDGDAEVGQPFGEYWGRDVVLEIDNKSITHRPDLWGLYGFARELSAIFGRPLEPYPGPELPIGDGEVRVDIQDGLRCRRYMAAIFDGVRVQTSPRWLQQRLRAVGVRSINTIVDISNYVMMELGQPTHAFDLAKLQGDTIGVRMAKSGEKLVTLDGNERKLQETVQLITDASGPIALAGVMGGEATEISETTQSLLLESATFDPVVTRRASVTLGLRSEAVARFEKDLDPTWTELAVRRFLDLASTIDPEIRLRGSLIDAWGGERPSVPKVVLRLSQVERKLGVPLSADQVRSLLESIAFCVEVKGEALEVTVPSHRATKDVQHEDDLIEEVGRLYGYNNIPPQVPSAPVTPPRRDPVWDVTRRVQDVLSLAGGFHEVYDYSFGADELIDACGLAAEPHLKLRNPIAANMTRLRRSLVPGMLVFLQKNLRFERDFRIFQVGRGYHPEREGESGLPFETREVVGIGCRRSSGKSPSLFFEMKGSVDTLLAEMGVSGELESERSPDLVWIHPSRSAAVVVGDREVGYVGELHPRLIKELDLEADAALFSLDLRVLAELRDKDRRFRELPRFPSSRLDISVIVPVTQRVRSLERSIIEAASPYVSSARLFDVYEGKQIPEGHRSLSFEIEFQAEDRTLTDEEITGFQDRIVETLAKAHSAQLRG
ncbi:MAG: phenylalanine--tRNA ligase subunit beta [Planctomycetota bacterium]